MTQQDPAEIARKLAEIRQEHRDLDQAINLLALDPQVDQLQLTRMKKRRLRLKDWITVLESQMIPDLDA
jgi:hypothetical protein